METLVDIEIHDEKSNAVYTYQIPEKVADYIHQLQEDYYDIDLENTLMIKRFNKEIEDALSIHMN